MTEERETELAEQEDHAEETPEESPGGSPEAGQQSEAGDRGPATEPAALEDVAATAQEFLSGLLAAMGLEAEVSCHSDEERVTADVTGADLGILIGRRGQTLDALQELTRTAVQRRLKARVRLLVDVEGYRARRQQSLIEYAVSMAQRAMERGTEIELEPMSSFERRIVHNAVSEVEGAVSYSEGEEPERRVIIRGS